jgi:SagB-type dehydrogenase family enzyme
VNVPFIQVLEDRTSVRKHFDEKPINAKQLGEFLYRVGRVRQILEPDPQRGLHYQASTRPYPSGGGGYDLELYVTVRRCTDLSAGIYHYEPFHHRLSRLVSGNEYVTALLADAKRAAGIDSEPQILIVLTSRFQRLTWKYTGIAYSTVLKNVGALYQTMYLVATAMGLAPCALGLGNSSLFAEASGIDYFTESSVGEFLLGSRQDL